MELSGGCAVSSHSALMGHVIVRSAIVGWFHISLRSATCHVELRARSERLSRESVRSLELPQCPESLSAIILMNVASATKIRTL